MSKLFSSSPLMLGVIEDVEISNIKQSPISCRRFVGSVSELGNSIRGKGLLQPIVVRTKDSHFEIVSGNRRLQACKSLGWRKIICHIVELDDMEAFEVSLVENIQRKTLDPKEEAQAFKTYILSFGWGGLSSLAFKIGKSPAFVHRRIKLLDLPPEVLDSISNCSISTASAEELLSVRDKEKQSELGQLVCKNRLSSRKVREMVRNLSEDPVYNYHEIHSFSENVIDVDRKTLRSFDKSIIALKIALNKIGTIISDIEDNWIAYEVLMQHKNMLHTQIDLLIKERKKL